MMTDLAKNSKGNGFALALRAAEEIQKFYKDVDEHFTWLEEILIEAKKSFVTPELQLLPKTPTAKRTRRARKPSRYEEDNEENVEPSSKRAKSSRARKVDFNASSDLTPVPENSPEIPLQSNRTTRASRQRTLRNANKTNLNDSTHSTPPETGKRSQRSQSKKVSNNNKLLVDSQFASPRPIQGFLRMSIKEKTDAYEEMIARHTPENQRSKATEITSTPETQVIQTETPPTVVLNTTVQQPLRNKSTSTPKSGINCETLKKQVPSKANESTPKNSNIVIACTPETLKKFDSDNTNNDGVLSEPKTPAVAVHNTDMESDTEDDKEHTLKKRQSHQSRLSRRSSVLKRRSRTSVVRKCSIVAKKLSVAKKRSVQSPNEVVLLSDTDDDLSTLVKTNEIACTGMPDAKRPARSKLRLKKKSQVQHLRTQNAAPTDATSTTDDDEASVVRTRSKMPKQLAAEKVNPKDSSDEEPPVKRTRSKMPKPLHSEDSSHIGNTDSSDNGEESTVRRTRSKLPKSVLTGECSPNTSACSNLVRNASSSSDQASPKRSTRSKMPRNTSSSSDQTSPKKRTRSKMPKQVPSCDESSPQRSTRSKMRQVPKNVTSSSTDDEQSPVRSTRSKMRVPKAVESSADEASPVMRSTRSKMRVTKPVEKGMFAIPEGPPPRPYNKRPHDDTDDSDSGLQNTSKRQRSLEPVMNMHNTSDQYDSDSVKTPEKRAPSARNTPSSCDEDDIIDKTPSPRCPTHKIVRPAVKTFLRTAARSSPRPNSTVIRSFIQRNTPTKKNIREIQAERKQKILEKEKRDRQRVEEKNQKIQKEMEERRKKNGERMRRVKEAKERKDKEHLEKNQKVEQKLHEISKLKSAKSSAEKLSEKREQRLKRIAGAEERRRLEEEERQRKLLEQVEEQRKLQELQQRRKEFEEKERQRKMAEQRRLEEEKRAEIERQQQLEADRLRKLHEEREREEQKQREEKEMQLAKGKADREKAELEKRVEREKQEKARLEYERDTERKRILAEAYDKAQKEIVDKHARHEQSKIEAVIKKHNSSLNKSTSSALNSTFNKEDTEPQSYEITPARKHKPASAENYDITDLHSDDSTDDEEAPRKKIPTWATGSSLKCALINQHYHPPDVDNIFPTIDDPDLNVLFVKKKARFNKRTSSAIWDSPLQKPGHGSA